MAIDRHKTRYPSTRMQIQTTGPLHADLAELLQAARDAERDIFALLADEVRDRPRTIGDWSAKDVQAHLAAWRAIEARRLEATARGEPLLADDPATDEPIDDSNAHLHAQRAGWSWQEVDKEADDSVRALIDAIALSSHDVLCECDGTVTGIGSNGTNHAMAHLSDIVPLTEGGLDRYDALVNQIEAILSRRHLRPRDTGVMLYNIACHHALSGELDEARRLLRIAFAHRRELVESAAEDPDLAALREEISSLA
jgi:hypothetical protein